MLILSAVSLHKALRRQPKCAPTSPVCPSILSDRQHPRQVGEWKCQAGREITNFVMSPVSSRRAKRTDGRHASCITSPPRLARPAKNRVFRSVWQVLSFSGSSRRGSANSVCSQPSINFTAGASINSRVRRHRLANGRETLLVTP